jgi:ubiquinone/menaquinone biosynthesis C-methylase UbiE
MATPADTRRERSSAYFVQEQENREEFQRLHIQDQMLTVGMGGVLPELAHPTRLRRVLDVGCGTGHWLIETANAYPDIELLVGVDVNRHLISYARAQAREHQVSDRVQFQTMDALCMLEFPNEFFDLVNQRLGESWLRIWEWGKLLSEYRRITRHNSVVRITEADLCVKSNSSALSCLSKMAAAAFYQSGHLFTPKSRSVLDELEPLLDRFALQQVQTRTHRLQYHAGTPEWRAFSEDMRLGFQIIQPFLRQWGRIPENYGEIYQQAMRDIEQPGFVGQMELLTVWGTWRPERK